MRYNFVMIACRLGTVRQLAQEFAVQLAAPAIGIMKMQ
jgi:hypothetical protein